MSRNRQNKNDRKRQRRKAFTHGRDRQTVPQDQRSPYPKSSAARRDDSGPLTVALADWTTRTFDLSPGAVNAVNDPSLTSPAMVRLVQEAQDRINQQIAATMIYGNAPTNINSIFIRKVLDLYLDQRPPLTREMAVGEIVAYRCWRLEDGQLRSIYMRDWWRPGEVMIGREIEDWDQRGIHGWKAPDSREYFDYVRGYLNRHRVSLWCTDEDETKPSIITGSVYLWGDVVEHEHGYRAEYASIRSLDWIYPSAEQMGREIKTLMDLRARYHV